MKILALEKEASGVTDEQFTETILEAEGQKVWELHQSGVPRELYFSADDHEAVLILECESADDARRRLDELPLVRAGLIDFRIMPLVSYPGVARLLAQKP